MTTDPTEGFWRQDAAVCRRCGEERSGRYCSHCGQKDVERLTVRGTLAEVAHHLTSLDSVVLHTVVGLTRQPGTVIRGYVAGNRSGYLNPAKYAFLAATLYAFVIHFFEIDVRPAGWQNPDPRALAGMRLVVGLLGYLVFAYLLPAAAVLQRLFRRHPMNFAESYAALLFYAGHYLTAISLLALAGVFSLDAGFWLVRGVGFVILLWLIADLYRSSWIRTLLSTVAVYAVVVVGGMLSGILSVLGYWLIRRAGG